jgi:DNA primase
MVDNDEAGKKYEEQIAASLAKRGIEFHIVTLADGFKDVSDYVEAGHSKEDLQALMYPVEPEVQA